MGAQQKKAPPSLWKDALSGNVVFQSRNFISLIRVRLWQPTELRMSLASDFSRQKW
jgi:hypothetical protein